MQLAEQSPFPLPTVETFLQLLRQKIPSETFDLQDWKAFHDISPLEPSDAIPEILGLANKLRTHPRLLHGANVVFGPRYKIHCTTTEVDVKHFVVVDQETHKSQTYSWTDLSFTLSNSTEAISEAIDNDATWGSANELYHDPEWLACVAQTLREMLDDPTTQSRRLPVIRKCLGHLGKRGILPISVFIHYVDHHIPDYESMIDLGSTASGGFCDAHKITVNNVDVCFRVLRQHYSADPNNITLFQQYCRELSVWHQLKHRNILSLMGASTEAFPASYLKTHPNHDKHLAITQIADGLNYLHQLNPPIAHKDLKGDNVLVGPEPDLVCMITDFGLASLLETQRSTSRGKGTPYWMAPELFTGERIDQDARPRDMFSFGITIAELLIGGTPKKLWSSVLQSQPMEMPPVGELGWTIEEQGLWDLVKLCTQIIPGRRPRISNIKRCLAVIKPTNSPFFRVDSHSDDGLTVKFESELKLQTAPWSTTAKSFYSNGASTSSSSMSSTNKSDSGKMLSQVPQHWGSRANATYNDPSDIDKATSLHVQVDPLDLPSPLWSTESTIGEVCGSSDHESGFVVCETCDLEIMVRDESGNFTTQAWEAHRINHWTGTPTPNHAPRRGRPPLAVRPTSAVKSRSNRSEQERIDALDSDPFVAKFEPHRVLCVLCKKWIKLRKYTTYCTTPWDLHLKKCMAKRSKNRGTKTSTTSGGYISSPPVSGPAADV